MKNILLFLYILYIGRKGDCQMRNRFRPLLIRRYLSHRAHRAWQFRSEDAYSILFRCLMRMINMMGISAPTTITAPPTT